MFEKLLYRSLPAVAVAALLVSTAQAVIIETVRVGNPGNSNDTEQMNDGTTGYGGVDYVYNIGKYEVTAGQYTEFLNAVAAEDTYGLYNGSMWSSDDGCKIQRSGSSGSYSYSVAGDRMHRPVNFVSWGDATRFANWLHNGQPTGGQGNSTTENGAYFLDGATSNADLMAITRQANATWVIPTENEWYKAAYYDGASSVYYDYPTGSDSVPSNDLINPDPGNNANFYQDGYTIGSPYYMTVVGEFENSDSPYGTFDQGGNVWEWNETVIDGGSYRSARGGFWERDSLHLPASVRTTGATPTYDYAGIGGFRVASVPEPGGITLLVCGLIAGLIWWRRRK